MDVMFGYLGKTEVQNLWHYIKAFGIRNTILSSKVLKQFLQFKYISAIIRT